MPHRKEHVLADVAKGGAEHVERADRGRTRGARRLGAHAVGGARRRVPARGRAARRPVAHDAERRHDAQPVEDGPPGRDRRRLRADRLLALQPSVHDARSTRSSRSRRPGVWNRMEYRPLEGFVFAVTPFNFTAIGGNLPARARADGQHGGLEAGLDGGPLRVLRHAPLPGGRPAARRHQPRLRQRRGDRRRRRSRARELAGVHFTGSTPVFQACGRRSATTSQTYRNYPRIVGETGGKDFILAHPSADVDAVATAIVRGSFEYQGQKCSAASRALRAVEPLAASCASGSPTRSRSIRMGDVADFSNFMGAVIDEQGARRRTREAIEEARAARGHRDRRRRRRRRQRGLLRRADRDRDARPATSGSCARSSSGRS